MKRIDLFFGIFIISLSNLFGVYLAGPFDCLQIDMPTYFKLIYFICWWGTIICGLVALINVISSLVKKD